MERYRFPFLRPEAPTPDRWVPYLEPAYTAGRYTNFGPVNGLFERRLESFAEIPGRRAVACASGTSGLAAALMGLGVRGKVAIPSFTFPATLHSVLMAGCQPVLCDVDAVSWELSAEIVQSTLARHDLGAVVHVRALGLCRDLEPVARVCENAGIPLLVDAAAAFGGKICPGVAAGGQGTAEIFSLHVTKVIGIGEGGAIFCRPEDAGRIARSLNFGLGAPGFSRALNGKLSEFAAAVGLAVLDTAERTVQARAAAAERYRGFFVGVAGLMMAADPGLPTWQCFPVLFPNEGRAAHTVEFARRRGLELRRYYSPSLHRVASPEYAVLDPAPVAESLAGRMVCFPIYPAMQEEEQAKILEIVRALLDDFSSE